MKMRRISYLLIALFPFFCLTTYGQNEALTEDIRTAINKVFEHTDLSKVPTGILSDYGIETIPLSYYSGRKGISQILPPIYFLSFYDGLYSCMVNKRKVYQSIWVEQTLSLIG